MTREQGCDTKGLLRERVVQHVVRIKSLDRILSKCCMRFSVCTISSREKSVYHDEKKKTTIRKLADISVAIQSPL